MSRWWWRLTAVLVVVGFVWIVVRVAQLGQAARDDASTYGAFVLALLGSAVGAVRVATQRLAARADVAPDLDRLADDLATAMRDQWTQAATDRRLSHPLPIRWRRSTEPVAGRVVDATRATPSSLPPLPGIERTVPGQLDHGTHRMLHKIYGGLASGRLILIGGPGTGKSAAAILLLLDALRYRDQRGPAERARIPVPVLFTLQGWEPDAVSVHDWVTAKLAEIPLFAGRGRRPRAEALLRAGRIAVFLDGLDEIAPALRGSALRALSEQATFRLVLLTRTAELVDAARHHALTGAVALELLPLTNTDTAAHLQQRLIEPAPAPWQQLIGHLTGDPTSTVSRALTSPLTVTLLRDVYPPTRTGGSPVGDVDELLDHVRFPDSESITDHLLDHAVTAAYSPRPGQAEPRYTTDTAHRALVFVAEHLRATRTRDLGWWTIPAWLTGRQRARVGVVAGLVAWQAFGMTMVLVFAGKGDWPAALLAGQLTGFSAGPVIAVAVGWMQRRPKAISPLSLRFLPSPVDAAVVLVVGLAGGSLFWLGFEPAAGVIMAFGFIVPIAAVIGLTNSFDGELTPIAGPPRTQRSDLVAGLVVGLVAGLVGGVAFGVVGWLTVGPWSGVEIGSAVGLAAVLAGWVWTSQVWTVWICQLYLYVRHGTPLRLMRFLEDARTRHLLRTVGPVYQFRHATLQDRLAPPAASRAGLAAEPLAVPD